MRFSLRTLLLMFPVIVLLAYGLACAVAFVQVVPERPGSTVDRILLANEASSINVQLAKFGTQVNAHALEQWLQNELPAGHRDASAFLATFQFRQDHWGRNIHCVALSPAGLPLPEVALANSLGFYSVGRDGKSLSHGMDADDVNSWSTTNDQTQAMGSAWVYERMREQAGYYIPWTLAVVMLCAFFVMWFKAKPKRGTLDAV